MQYICTDLMKLDVYSIIILSDKYCLSLLVILLALLPQPI